MCISGRKIVPRLTGFAARVAQDSPEAIVVTGDLTFRARAREFAAATDWLVGLNRPLVLSPGNHDLPYFNPFKRFAAPYRRFAALSALATTELDLAHVAIVSLDTTAAFQWRWNWAEGRVSGTRLRQAVAAIRAVPDGRMVLVACHHPLIALPGSDRVNTEGGADALKQLCAAGADALLSGHVHNPFDFARECAGRSVRLIGAGTLSRRVRGSPPSFNEINIGPDRLETLIHKMV